MPHLFSSGPNKEQHCLRRSPIPNVAGTWLNNAVRSPGPYQREIHTGVSPGVSGVALARVVIASARFRPIASAPLTAFGVRMILGYHFPPYQIQNTGSTWESLARRPGNEPDTTYRGIIIDDRPSLFERICNTKLTDANKIKQEHLTSFHDA